MKARNLFLSLALSLLAVNNVCAEGDTIETKVFDVKGVGLKMVKIPAGSYMAGAQNVNPSLPNYDPNAKADESPVHKVNLDSFWMGETEVTQELWQAVTGSDAKKEGWSKKVGKGNDFPAYYLSYNEISQFITKLNLYMLESDKLPADMEFALPTEAEWEYAARGGDSLSIYAGSDSINHVAWYWGNSESQVHRVGEKKANAFGLKDMTGNLWEWTSDLYFQYPDHEVKNPVVNGKLDVRVLKGGSWMVNEKKNRLTVRQQCGQDFEYVDYGFRLVLRHVNK